jgi:putative Mg2+ transporter-C (MgtC) family protein
VFGIAAMFIGSWIAVALSRRQEKLAFRRGVPAECFVVLTGNEETALRLGAALIVGTILGLNRELHGKPAGLRTHALVSLGAAMATVVVLKSSSGSLAADQNAVSRVVQGILTGVGFLGAGVILHDPGGHISGLTTAATIWICAVLGLVCGMGHWGVLGIAVVLTALVLALGRPLERLAERLFKRHISTPPDHSV